MSCGLFNVHNKRPEINPHAPHAPITPYVMYDSLTIPIADIAATPTGEQLSLQKIHMHPLTLLT